MNGGPVVLAPTNWIIPKHVIPDEGQRS